jgi:hypothetical protein
VRVIDNPWKTPARCIVIPHITQQTPNITWIDTNAEIVGGPRDNHVYVSDVAVRQMMATLGYHSPAEYDALERQYEQAEEALVALLAKLEAAEKQIEAVGLLQGAGIVVKPPKRPKEPVAA